MGDTRTQVTVRLGNRTLEMGPAHPRAVIGRDDATCDLSVNLPAVSRRHVEIVLFGDEPHIRDLGSANGTWVDDEAVQSEWVRLTPGQRVHLGEVPLEVEWAGGGGSTTMEIASELLIERIESMQAAQQAAAEAPLSVEQTLKLQGIAELPYRWEGETATGRLLMALPGELFDSAGRIEGAATFTAFDEAKVASILVELVERSHGTRSKGRVWDRASVLDRPWRVDPNQQISANFSLELPAIATPSGPKVEWEVRGLVDIDWAKDIKANCPCAVRNRLFDHLADAWGEVGGTVGQWIADQAGASYRADVSLLGAAKEAARTGDIRFELLVSGDALRLATVSRRLLGSDRRSELHVTRRELETTPPDQLGKRFFDALMALS